MPCCVGLRNIIALHACMEILTLIAREFSLLSRPLSIATDSNQCSRSMANIKRSG